MSFASSLISVHKPETALTWIAPYYGTADVNSVKDQNLIKSLQYRGVGGTRNTSFAIDANGMSTSMFYAYPKLFGLATFYDTQSQFEGGWDGASSGLGPIEVTVNLEGQDIVFYLYQTDHTNLGPAANNQWQIN